MKVDEENKKTLEKWKSAAKKEPWYFGTATGFFYLFWVCIYTVLTLFSSVITFLDTVPPEKWETGALLVLFGFTWLGWKAAFLFWNLYETQWRNFRFNVGWERIEYTAEERQCTHLKRISDSLEKLGEIKEKGGLA